MTYSASELILNPDGSIYHLHLKPEHVAPLVFTVGDPDRVGEVSKHFDNIEHKVQHREFVTHTGSFKGRRVMALSTGIGTDNIDIVMTELDALVNIDLETRTPKAEKTVLDIVRLGTSGSIQEEMPLDSLLVTTMAVGFDNLMHFYDANITAAEMDLTDHLVAYLENRNEDLMLLPYCFSADKSLLEKLAGAPFETGVTITAPGFYGPQGRLLRGKAAEPKLLKHLSSYKRKELILTNLEMETAGIYGLARLLGHRAVSCSAIVANRVTGQFSSHPERTIESLIRTVLERFSN